PAVINMSVGSHYGPHDSTSLASQCLTNLTLRADGSTVPGKILVAAAGNEGAGGGLGWIDYGNGWERTQAYTHTTGMVGATPTLVPFRVGFDHYVGTEREPIEIFQDLSSYWFNGDHNLQVRVGVVHSASDVTWTSLYSYNDLLTEGEVQLLSSASGVYGHVNVIADQNAAGARCFRVYISDWDSDGAEGGVAFVVELTNPSGESVRVDGFIEVSNDVRAGGFLDLDVPTGNHLTVDNQMSIGFPGNNPNVLAVGSYVTRSSLGEGAESPDVEGDRAGSSSRGPTRDEAMTGFKPDIMAPGQFIVAPLSSDYLPHLMEQYLENVMVFEGAYGERDSYIAFQGTSMASPVVAGTVALMLEHDPELSLERLREILYATSTSDRFTGEVPNYDFGYGKLNAHLAMQELTGTALAEGCSAAPVLPWFILPLLLVMRRRRLT
ncbi:MAG: S8 family serine peptidase, partial [Deltaproteobacteria bacterium]|nr:S8 family serine peptidase [Deltaproteobacteria bacterium]